MSTNDIRQEIERILKEIQKTYGIGHDKLYYKMRGEKLNRLSIFSLFSFTHLYKIFTDPNLEYALYVDATLTKSPSRECILFGYGSSLSCTISGLFFPPFAIYDTNILKTLSKYVGEELDVDPLSQVLSYWRVSPLMNVHNVYICTDVMIIEPYNPDPLSPFPGKRGVVAYCITLNDLIRMLVNIRAVFDFDIHMYNIRERIKRKLMNDFDLWRSWLKDPVKACDISLIKSIIHDEIEEAERITRQYNFVRVALPLD